MIITSTSNARIKEIRKLKDKKDREASGLFYIEGLRIVIEALKQDAPIEQLIVNYDLLKSENGQQMVESASARDIEVIEVSEGVFNTLALKDHPQGIAAVIRQDLHKLDEMTGNNIELWTAFDSIADPGNLGTVMRTMDAVGGQGIILIDHCTDPYDPSTTRASMGALFSLKVIKASTEEFISWKKMSHIPVIGTSDKAKQEYREAIYPEKMVLLMGSERQGMQEKLSEVCDEIVRIPMVGISDSLNLSIANAVILYEVFHQKRNLQEKGQI